MKLCIDCRWHQLELDGHYHFCRRPIPRVSRQSLVTGQTIFGPSERDAECWLERGDIGLDADPIAKPKHDSCGPTAIYFEPKP